MTNLSSTIALVLALLAVPCLAESPEQVAGGAVLHPADEIEWGAAPRSLPSEAKMAVLAGDVSKEGPFVLRLKLPDGYHLAAHTHPRAVGLTVISGSLQVGKGERVDAKKGTSLGAGSYASWNAGVAHSLLAGGETIVQLHGEGPWEIDYQDKADDPREAMARRRAAARARIEFTEESLAEVKRNVDAGKAVMVDVRSKQEWNEGYLAGSIFLPNDSLRGRAFDPDKLPEVLPEGKVLYTFCQVGMRAKAAAKVLTQYGYEVRVLQPGYEELLEAGFEQGEE